MGTFNNSYKSLIFAAVVEYSLFSTNLEQTKACYSKSLEHPPVSTFRINYLFMTVIIVSQE